MAKVSAEKFENIYGSRNLVAIPPNKDFTIPYEESIEHVCSISRNVSTSHVELPLLNGESSVMNGVIPY